MWCRKEDAKIKPNKHVTFYIYLKGALFSITASLSEVLQQRRCFEHSKQTTVCMRMGQEPLVPTDPMPAEFHHMRTPSLFVDKFVSAIKKPASPQRIDVFLPVRTETIRRLIWAARTSFRFCCRVCRNFGESHWSVRDFVGKNVSKSENQLLGNWHKNDCL